MCAPKLRLGRMAAGAVLVADQAVHPAIRLAAVAEIVDQLGMALGDDPSSVEVDREVVVARQAAEEALGDLAPVGGEHVEPERQVAWRLAIGVGCTMVRKRAARQHRERQQVAAAEQVVQRLDRRDRAADRRARR